jgi:hypothetical protein
VVVEGPFDDVAGVVGRGVESARAATGNAASLLLGDLVGGLGDDGLDPLGAQEFPVRA